VMRLETFGGSSPATGDVAQKASPIPEAIANNTGRAAPRPGFNCFGCRMYSSQVSGIVAGLAFFQSER